LKTSRHLRTSEIRSGTRGALRRPTQTTVEVRWERYITNHMLAVLLAISDRRVLPRVLVTRFCLPTT